MRKFYPWKRLQEFDGSECGRTADEVKKRTERPKKNRASHITSIEAIEVNQGQLGLVERSG